MKCSSCDNKQSLKAEKTTHKFSECGLNYVTIKGVTKYHCDKCGEDYMEFGDLEKLHEAIANTIAKSKPELDSYDVRFLRKYLGYSTEMFADLTGFVKETISRIENGKLKPTKVLQSLLRANVFLKQPNREYDKHDLLIAQSELKELKSKKFAGLTVTRDHGTWSAKPTLADARPI